VGEIVDAFRDHDAARIGQRFEPRRNVDAIAVEVAAVLHHVADEETTLLPDAERLLGEQLEDLGLQMTKRRLELTVPRAGEIAVNTVRAIPATSMVLAAVAVVAGAYVVKRAMSREAA